MDNEYITEEYIQTLLEERGGSEEYRRQTLGEWIVAPEPRTFPNRKYISTPANSAEMIREGFDFNTSADNIRVAISLSYRNVKEIMNLLEEARASGELFLDNDEVILEARIDLNRQMMETTGLCTPHRNMITGR